MSDTNTRYRAGIDIGGTFTDFILFDETGETIRLHKRLTTPHDPSEAALEGLRELLEQSGVDIGELGEIVHGTTLVTNALIERKGAKLGMVTTSGFRDIIEIGTEQRYDIYDLNLTYPDSLVPRSRRIEIEERMGADGEVFTPLDDASLTAAIDTLVAQGVEAVAVCLMHGYRNPAHELKVRDVLTARFPALSVSVSHEVVAEISEYPRFVTTCANAYVQPLMDAYLGRLEVQLADRGFTGDLRLMHSAGGLVPAAEARAFPIRLLESGPAGGALATAWFGAAAGQRDVLAFDMGGTTAKACLIENGTVDVASSLEAGRVRRFKNGSGLPIKTPVVDLIEIGAGGGSIAHVDDVGLLQVGPESAGAAPGPACYGAGGDLPTVTDASVALGYYDPTFFLGGRMTLDLDAAHAALDKLAEPLGLSRIEAAWGIHEVVGENMANAARIHMVEKGRDPRRYAMIGFGGAGPAFAARVARILGIGEVIVPPASGAASAFGFLTAPIAVDLVQSRPLALSEDSPLDDLLSSFSSLEVDARDRLAAAGVPEADMRMERRADMRCVGQVHEITVSLPADIGAATYQDIRAAFEAAYEQRFTAVPAEAKIEILSFRLRGAGPDPKLTVTQSRAARGGEARKGSRMAYFGTGFVETAIYDRYSLAQGDVIAGPAIVEEAESTTLIPPGDSATLDEAGNLRITIGASQETLRRPERPEALEEQITALEADPVSLEIMWSRLVTVAEEMWQAVRRTAYSLIISESQDFGCTVLDAGGDILAHSVRVMPAFNLTLPIVAKAVMKRYPVDTMKPGDVFVTNDPWLCAGHLFDIAVITPVFKHGKVVAFTGSVGHVGDIGGTRNGVTATELYEEGLQIPPMKLVRAGVENEDLLRIIGENLRDAGQVIGDVRSFVAANATGARRLEAFLDEYGLADLVALATVLESRAEDAMRRAISDLPDGSFSSSVVFNPVDGPQELPVTVRVEGEHITIDFEGAPPEMMIGGVNCTMSYATACSIYPIKCMLTPNVRGNAGCFRPFSVTAPEGSIMNARKPAPVSLRTRTGWFVSPNIFRALSKSAPDKVLAHTGLPSLLSVYGRTPDGEVFYDHLLSGGGQGASAGQDGKSSLMWPTSAATSSVEMMEARSPVVLLEKQFVTDSGGVGATRGGLGVRLRLVKRYADDNTVTVFLSPEGVDSPVPGLFGGGSGIATYGVMRDHEGAVKLDIGTGGLLDLTDARDVVELQLGGGSGYGNAADRPREAVEHDLREGYISAEAAERDYGLGGRIAAE